MSINYVAICAAKREYFEPPNPRDYGMLAKAEPLVKLMLGDWIGCPVVIEHDWDDERADTTGWVNRFTPDGEVR